MFGSRRRLTRLAGARLHRNSGNSYRPGCESLETRLVLHGSAWSGAIPIPQAAVDPVAAGAQVLTISQTSIAQFKALQLKLDTLSARLQHQTHSARQATVNHVQTIVQQFVKQENKRYKQVQAIAATVSGSAMFTAVAQFEQGIHQRDFYPSQSGQPPRRFRCRRAVPIGCERFVSRICHCGSRRRTGCLR
jgi:hypothetical protein